MEMLSRTNTLALRGVAAIGIVVFHILLGYAISPFFNMWGGFFVALFLILSGYGLEESFRQNGLDGFWRKRIDKVLLPTAFFICAYNFLFPYLSPDGDPSPEASMHNCLDELLYIKPTFWFVFFIAKCYVVYWLGSRFLKGRLRLLFFVACALVCLNLQAPCGHLEAEQSFSFLAGVLLSMNKTRLETLSDKEIKRGMFLLLFFGAVFFSLKAIPQLHDLKGNIAYNYLLCPFRLSIGLAFIPLFSMLSPERSALMRKAGKYSLEIYIAHVPFIGLITDAESTAVFFAYSVLAFAILLGYRRLVAKKLSIAEALFIIVNVLFVAKYSARISEEFALYATLSAVVFYYVLLRLVIPYYIRSCGRGARGKTILIGACLFAFVGMLVIQYAINPYSIQVDRWSALHFPIQNLLLGDYPYSANTHLGGNASPFPVWQILHIPFYLLGNVGLSFFVAAGLFLWSCYKAQGSDKAMVVSLLLCASAAVWYEVAVRSDLITNLLFLAAIINVVSSYLSQKWVEENRWWIACAVGLLACTRFLVLVPISLLLLPYYIRMDWRKQISVTILTFAVFALTFVPFVVWDWQAFFYSQNSPWALQTSQVNLSDFILFGPLAIYLSMNHKGNQFRYYRNTAVMLVVLVSVTFVHNMYLEGNWNLFSPAYDITYFSTALPFCLLALARKDGA
jgi:hypothetical protein